jgi:hypothetical protein
MAKDFDPTEYGAIPVDTSSTNQEEGPWSLYAKPSQPPTAAATAGDDGPWNAYKVAKPAKEGQVGDDDLQSIASRRGISVDILKNALPYFTGFTGPETPQAAIPQKLAGEVGKALAFELPQKLYVLSQSSPKVQAALDDLRELIEDRKTTTQVAAEIATSIIPAVGIGVLTGGASLAAPIGRAILPQVAKETGKRAVARAAITGGIEGAAGGALLGVGRSRTGEELQGAAEGTLFPGVIGAGAAGAFRAAQAFRKVSPKIAQELEDGLKTLDAEADLSGKIEQRLATTKQADDDFVSFIKDEEGIGSLIDDLKSVRKQIKEVRLEGGDVAPLMSAQKELLGKAAKVREFGEFVTGKSGISLNSAVDEVSKQAAIFGDEIGSTYATFRRAQTLPEELGRLATEGSSKLSKQAQRTLDLTVSGRYAAADIDRSLKTDAVRILDDFATADTAFKITTATVKTSLNRIIKEANKAGIAPDQITSVLRKATTPEEIRALIPEKEKADVVVRMREFFDSIREDVASTRTDRTAVKMGFLETYAPQKLADDATVISKIDALTRDVEKQFSTKVGNPSTEAKQTMGALIKEYQEEIRPLMIFSKKAIDPTEQKVIDNFQARAGSFGTLLHAIDYLSQGDLLGKAVGKGKEVDIEDILRFTRSLDNADFLGARTEKIAGSAMERQLRAPEIILENNVFKLGQKYAYDLYRTAYYKKTVDGLKGVQEVARRAGDARSEAWVTNALKDLAGVRPGTGLAKYKEVTQAVQVWALKKANETVPGSVSHSALTYLSESPEILSNMLNSVYPYYLGGSVRSFVNNLGGATFTLAPEVGVQYSANVFKGYLRLAKLLSTGEEITLSQRTADYLNKMNPRSGAAYAAGETILTRNPSLFVMNTLGGSGSLANEAFTTLNKALDKNALARTTTSAINKWTDLAMYFFEKSESINRFVALDVGQDIARDLMEKKPGALALLGKMDQSYRIAVRKAVDSNNTAEVQRLTQRWLVAKTMFDYNRLNQAEAARFMGPLFSTFTTYPANVWGDAVNSLRERGALKGGADLVARRFLPLIAAMSIGSYFIPEPGESQIADVMFGKEKLAGMTPAASVLSMTTRGITPPALQVAGQGIKAAATADLYEFWRFFNSGMAFIPGASFIKFIGSDLPTAIYGKPESKTTLGRAVETFTGGSILLDEDIKQFTKDYKEMLTDPAGD